MHTLPHKRKSRKFQEPVDDPVKKLFIKLVFTLTRHLKTSKKVHSRQSTTLTNISSRIDVCSTILYAHYDHK